MTDHQAPTVGDAPVGLLPATVAMRAGQIVGEVADSPHEVEQRAVAASVASRRREFFTGRWCARAALRDLGWPPCAIPIGPERQPVWPDQVVGSIAHDTTWCLAAVARRIDVASVGIDVEPDLPLPGDIWAAVTDLAELADADPGDSSASVDRLVFSIKEAVYKAWFPLTGRWLDFTDCRISVHPGHFRAQLLVPGPIVDGQRLQAFTGRWTTWRGHLVTAVAVPRRATRHNRMTGRS